MNDAELAADLAALAGLALLRMKMSGPSGKALGSSGDACAHQLISEGLATHRPNDGFVSEESSDDSRRLAKRRVWIVDPLDGTREFSEGRADWAVHVALAIDGRAEVGAVAIPARGLLFRSDLKISAPRKSRERLRIVVSRTRPPAEAEKIAPMLDADIITMGSCGAKAMAVVAGEADIYLHTGGQYEWDSCAPVAVARANGLHCSRIDGSPLLYNRDDLYMPDLLVCQNVLAETVLQALRA
jgi:3'(2'), 5'-bisphosphate nucleotidase